MSQDERKEWLRIAYLEVENIPGCEFFDRTAHARKVADHPAKIIPSIFGHKFTFDITGSYKSRLHSARKRLENAEAPALPAPPQEEYCTPEQIAAIKAEYGFDEPLPAPNLKANRPHKVERKLREPTPEELEEIARQFKAAHPMTEGDQP
ncbi:hypothetical protein M2336_001682 [Sphingobium sp. B1D7B]|uniref:hypothetical protein n=1 Tax=Sphingobium sp. B1D7B TaxID=2940578 RepID=UPI00222446C5|nr:hypothetical protein [Sphingobium sp. B1D7B]MCW2405053.1 hypothetical protein [Sphingobium sp. B1D7B]